MDVCSVKVWPCRWLKKDIRMDVQVIGTHPMFGPDSAKNGLKGLQMVICPLRQTPATLEMVKNVFKKMQLRIIETTPEEHDRQAAVSLAMVHFIGRGLGKMGIKSQLIETMGFRRLLAVNETVENDSWELFLDMHKFNPYAGKIRSRLVKKIDKLDKELKRKEKK